MVEMKTNNSARQKGMHVSGMERPVPKRPIPETCIPFRTRALLISISTTFSSVAGDFVEDVQLQKAIEVALTGLDTKVEDVTEYAHLFEVDAGAEGSGGLAALRPRPPPEIARARNLIEQARQGGVILTDEDLDEILTLLGGLGAGAKEN